LAEVEALHIPAVFASQTGSFYVAAGVQHTLQALQDKIDSGLKPASLPLERIASIQTSYERKKLQGRNVIGVIQARTRGCATSASSSARIMTTSG
jgi:hypothetical protein